MSSITDGLWRNDVEELLDAIYQRYRYDFRQYAQASLLRRITRAIQQLNLKDVRALQQYALDSRRHFEAVLQYLTVPISSMFRDSIYFNTLRRDVIPILKTYASPKIWIPGCSTGEEAYSMAILLFEHGLLDRCVIHATDINAEALEQAARGIYPMTKLRTFIENYHKSGGRLEFSRYYHAAYDRFLIDRRLRKKIIFAEHCLATDSSFEKMHLISCRNTLIYFNRPLQNKALGVFNDSLDRNGFLGLGSKETVEYSSIAANFDWFEKSAKIFRKMI